MSTNPPVQTGSVIGTVSDDKGDELPGVSLTLSGVGLPHATLTDPEGRFYFPDLTPGTYQINGLLEGFALEKHPPVLVSGGRPSEIELTMLPVL